MPTPIIEIEFFKSRSKSFEQVNRYAQIFSGYSKGDKTYTLKIFEMMDVFSHPSEFFYVLGEASKWVGTTVKYNGVIILDRPNSMLYKLKDISTCYSSFTGTSDKRHYCNHTGNGCRRLDQINLNGISGYVFRRWYKFGYFMEDGTTFKIDKDYLKELTAQESEDKMLDTCPAFSLDLVHVIIDQLPDTLDTQNGKWEIIYEQIVTAEGRQTVPFSVELNDIFGDEPIYATPLKKEKSIIEMSKEEIANLPESCINEMLDSGEWK